MWTAFAAFQKINDRHGRKIAPRLVEVEPPFVCVKCHEVWLRDACVAELVTDGNAFDLGGEVSDLMKELQMWINAGADPGFDASDWPTIYAGPGKESEPMRWALAESCAFDLLRYQDATAEEVIEVITRRAPNRWSGRAVATLALHDLNRAPDSGGQFDGKARFAHRVSRPFLDLHDRLVQMVVARGRQFASHRELFDWLDGKATDEATA